MNDYRKVAVGAVIVALLGFAVYALSDPVAFRRNLVMWMQLKEVKADVFMRSDLDDHKRADFLMQLDEARESSLAYFGECKANPILVFADNKELRVRFSIENPFAASSFHRSRTLAVIAPRGSNSNVMAHALAHAEIKFRLGEKAFGNLPAWFDEGFATQLDHREFLSDASLDTRLAAKEALPTLTEMSAPEWFQGIDGEAHLVLAKIEVRRWLRIAGVEGALSLLDRVASGEDFLSVYRELDRR